MSDRGSLENLKQEIVENIYTNENQAVTGDLLQDVLIDAVDTMGVSVSQNSQTGHTDINIGSDSYPMASVEEVSQLGQEVSENCIVNAKRISFSEEGYVPYTIKNGDKLIVRVIKSPGSSTNLYANPSQNGTGQVQVCTLEASNATYIYEAGMDSSYLRFTGANMSNGAIVEVIRANGLWEDVYELINIARYQSPSYPCFVAIGSDHKDVGGVTVNINDGVNPVYSVKVYSSIYYNAFLYLKLKGFDTTKTWVLGIFRNKMQGSEYKIYFYPLVDGSRDTSKEISFTITSQIANPAGVNVISCNSDSGNCRLDAIIDLSQIPATSQSQVLLSSYGDVFKVSPECFKHYADESEFKALQADVVALQANSLTDSDLTIDVLSNNIADPAGILLKTITSSSGNIQSNNDWDTYKLPVTPGNKYTIGGFSLGRTGFYAFYNGDTKLDYGNVSDPSGSAGPTLTAPANATWLYFDIKSGSSPSNPYQYLQINEGDTFLAYDAFEKGVTKINNINIAGVGGGGGSLSPEAFATLIQDLPTSADGSDVAVGYAYIDSSTGVVTVKLS